MNLSDNLIHIKDDRAVHSVYAKTVLEFKNLKVEELAFIYFMEDHKSPFAVYERDQRIIEV